MSGKQKVDPLNPPRYEAIHVYPIPGDPDFGTLGELEIPITVGERLRLWPGEDGEFETEDDVKGDWLCVESLDHPNKQGFVPEGFVRRLPDDEPAANTAANMPPPPPSQSMSSAAGMEDTPAAATGGGNSAAASSAAAMFMGSAVRQQPQQSTPAVVGGTTATGATPLSMQQQQQSQQPSTPVDRLRAMSPSMQASGGAGNPSDTSSSLLAKFRSGVAKTQMVNRTTNNTGIARPPALASAVVSEDYDELHKRNEAYFRKVSNARAEMFTSLTDMVANLSKQIQTSAVDSNDIFKSMQELEEAIDAQRREWKQQNEQEKNETTRARSRGAAMGYNSGVSDGSGAQTPGRASQSGLGGSSMIAT